MDDYGELAARTEAAGKKFDPLFARIRRLEGQMAQAAQLKMHTINYAKTRDVYMKYKQSGCSEAYRALHLGEIQKCEAAKAAFDTLGGKRIPKVKELSGEYATLLAEKNSIMRSIKCPGKKCLSIRLQSRMLTASLGWNIRHRKKGSTKKYLSRGFLEYTLLMVLG